MSPRVALIGCLTVSLSLGLASLAVAIPDYMPTFTKLYSPTPETPVAKAGCSVCHSDMTGKLNPYGADFGKQKTRDAAAFKAIEKVDSDKDGVSNLEEIRAGTLPGDPRSKPGAQKPPTGGGPAPPPPPDKAAAIPATARFVGAETCRMCHSDQYRRWAATSHARAFELLEIAGQAQNAACLGCHSTGFGRGGFRDASSTPELKGVQCESCHGPGSEHRGDPRKIVKTPSASVCAACHKDLHLH
ncbi:MAG: cytochrome c family protein [Armatimonadota bacterium]|nr:cytochrome c family protein [Armatimonadota bacterium]MDR7574402.1 cytochrome c family protein [Armatimonadota bacterium]MDR7588775.1 cytochrome c family protein [Armatimonadota bacterium]